MARVTVEDCLDKVDNRFQLVLLASKRARQLSLGTEPLVDAKNDKPTVLALREIAEGFITRDYLKAEQQNDVELLHVEAESAEEAESVEEEVDPLMAALQAQFSQTPEA